MSLVLVHLDRIDGDTGVPRQLAVNPTMVRKIEPAKSNPEHTWLWLLEESSEIQIADTFAHVHEILTIESRGS